MRRWIFADRGKATVMNRERGREDPPGQRIDDVAADLPHGPG
jgi:hypothetical protein